MSTVLLKALSFVLIILTGYLLKKLVFRDPAVQKLLAFILLNITLPATVIHAFGRFSRDTSMFFIILLGFLCSFIPMMIVYLASWRQRKEKRAFAMINVTGFNIGAFSSANIRPRNYYNVKTDGQFRFAVSVSGSDNSSGAVSLNSVSDLFAGCYSESVKRKIICSVIHDNKTARRKLSFFKKRGKNLIVFYSLGEKHFSSCLRISLSAFVILFVFPPIFPDKKKDHTKGGQRISKKVLLYPLRVCELKPYGRF